ncbi:hypothetical protein FAES_1915 [Fibrella aestuarina BUZ 2]|uniref:Uncharacterized protein n=1 Tax=Fibrella aestuarina BUZ 2 TaxID=1166018 RepID=I0K721_9BACT|nr:hypothetical protein FAES_1915 [Fibrella aestuarina BUZ 2]
MGEADSQSSTSPTGFVLHKPGIISRIRPYLCPRIQVPNARLSAGPTA